MGRAQARPPGQVHGDAVGGLPQRLPGARPRHQGRAGARPRRPLPRHARDQYQQCRRALRVAFSALQGLGSDSGFLRHSRRHAARDGGLHQHHADPGLSQLRPAGGHLRDRAADRHRRGPPRHRSYRAAAQEPDPSRSDAVPQRRRHELRQRALRGEHGLGDGHRRLEGLRAAPARRRQARQAARPRAGELRRSPRSARPTSRRGSPFARKDASTSSSVRSRAARATRPASRRWCPICSACR